MVTLGVSADLPYTQWKGGITRADFRFQDGELDDSAWAKANAAAKYCTGELTAGRNLAVHCAAGVNRSSLVAILVTSHFHPDVAVDKLITDLREAKHEVNPAWMTLTNKQFEDRLLAMDGRQ